MIEGLQGTRETVSYHDNFGFRLFINKEAEDYPLHWHTAVEIIMPLDNFYTVLVNERKYELGPEDIIILPSGELHQVFAPKEGKRIVVQFDYAILNHFHGLDSAFYMYHPCLIITQTTYKDVHGILKQLLSDMAKEYFSTSLLKEPYIYSLLLQFYVTLGRNCMNNLNLFPKSKSNKQHEYIDKFITVCNFMKEHCTEELSVEYLASLTGFSKYHFARLFKQFTGMTYYNYLNKHRIMYAEMLLLNPKLSITEVAMRSGFISLATFNRLFKYYNGCTPSEYKRLHGLQCNNLFIGNY